MRQGRPQPLPSFFILTSDVAFPDRLKPELQTPEGAKQIRTSLPRFLLIIRVHACYLRFIILRQGKRFRKRQSALQNLSDEWARFTPTGVTDLRAGQRAAGKPPLPVSSARARSNAR